MKILWKNIPQRLTTIQGGHKAIREQPREGCKDAEGSEHAWCVRGGREVGGVRSSLLSMSSWRQRSHQGGLCARGEGGEHGAVSFVRCFPLLGREQSGDVNYLSVQIFSL